MTIRSRPSLQRTLAAGICKLCLLATTGIAGEQPPLTCEALAGTYVATVTDREDVFASRSLLTFTADGAMLVTDSRQNGATALFKPVISSQGSWECVSSTSEGLEIEAIGFNFMFVDQDGLPTIGRIHYALKLDTAGTGLTGTAELSVAVSTDLEDAAPITDPGNLVETFGIDGTKATLP